jgi:hypothetical protein
MTLDLEHLTDPDVISLTERLSGVSKGASNRQTVAERIVELLYETLRVPDSDEPACVLVRCFQTSYYARLPMEYQHVADALLAEMPSHPNMRCLSLLATRGARRVWNDPATSTGHQCIPLPSVEAVRRAPMIARLLDEFGISVERLVALDDAGPPITSAAKADEGLDVFHVANALGSPFVPSQAEFVEPFGVKSVLAMGGLLSDGDLFAVILFTRVPVSAEVAARWGRLAGVVRETMLPFIARDTFARLDD